MWDLRKKGSKGRTVRSRDGGKRERCGRRDPVNKDHKHTHKHPKKIKRHLIPSDASS